LAPDKIVSAANSIDNRNATFLFRGFYFCRITGKFFPSPFESPAPFLSVKRGHSIVGTNRQWPLQAPSVPAAQGHEGFYARNGLCMVDRDSLLKASEEK
jgi:hypothetical protein